MNEEELRHPLVVARRQRGWSQEKLAALLRSCGLGTVRKTVTRWERDVVPDSAAQSVLRKLFGVAPETAQRLGWPKWLPTGHIAAVADSWDHQGAVSALSDVVEIVLMDRRGFLVLTGPRWSFRCTNGD